jgi:ketosteroid isomerase-like protein
MVEPSQVLHGRAEILAGFIGLSAYDATTHFNGQHTVVIAGDNATAETYCLAHHLFADDDGVRTLLVMSVRYLDVFVREADGWLITDRQIVIDWTDRRPSMP